MSSQQPPIVSETPEKSEPQASPAVKVTTSAATRGNRLAPAQNNLPLINRRETAVDGNANGANNLGPLMFSPPVIRRQSHQSHYPSSSHEPEEGEIEMIAQILGEKWCKVSNAAASERVHNKNETNGAEETGGDDGGGGGDAAAAAAEEIDEHLGEGEQNNNHTLKLLDGVADEDLEECVEFLEEMVCYDCDEFVSNIASGNELTKYAKHHARVQQVSYNLRPVLTKARALKEKVLNDGGKDDTHLIKAIVTTQNVVVSEELNCQDICRPESWLKGHQHFGQTKGVYIAVWRRDPVFDDDLRIRFEEAFQKKEFSYLSDDAKDSIRRIFSCVRNEIGRDNRLLRVKIGMILDEYLFQRMRTLHQSEGQFAQMVFIGTNDLCDDKVKELEDLLKYVCYRSTRASYSGRRKSCLAGVSSEVFYMHRNHIDFLITEAVEFVKTGSFGIGMPSFLGETDEFDTIRETDINNPNNPDWRQFCLKTNRNCHGRDCEYRN
eukprot:scaffold918_cov68-Skeletonema_dohrnii-CCMP3373.AAC.1